VTYHPYPTSPPCPQKVGDKHEPNGEIPMHGGSLDIGDPLPGSPGAATAKDFNFTVTTMWDTKYPFRAKTQKDRAIWEAQISAAITGAEAPKPESATNPPAASAAVPAAQRSAEDPATPGVVEGSKVCMCISHGWSGGGRGPTSFTIEDLICALHAHR